MIQDLSNGAVMFQMDKPVLSISRMEMEIYEKENVTGIVELFSRELKDGLPEILHSEPRLHCRYGKKTPESIEIEYEFTTNGLEDGDIIQGEIVFRMNGGECTLPYRISILKKYPVSSLGEIRNLFHFANLTKENPTEAVEIFKTAEFREMLFGKEPELQSVYDGFYSANVTPFDMEEFLIAVNKKTKVELSAVRDIVLEMPSDPEEWSGFQIIKSGWGFAGIEVSASEPFIELKETQISLEDFTKDEYTCFFKIHPQKMHDGKNEGKIRIASVYGTMEVCVTVWKQDRQVLEEQRKDRQEYKEHQTEIMKLYLQFEKEEISQSVFVRKTLSHLNRMLSIRPDDLLLLYKARIFLLNGQNQDAAWILNSYEKEKMEKVLHPGNWAYYLYVLAHTVEEEEILKNILDEIRDLYHRHKENRIIRYLLLTMDVRMIADPEKKFGIVKEFLNDGESSPFYYLLGARILRKNPRLLKGCDRENQKIVFWMYRQNYLTQEVAEECAKNLASCKQFTPLVFRTVCACYEVYPSEVCIEAVCMLLMRNEKTGQKYRKWYETGVRSGLRLTRLYEYYMMSFDGTEEDSLPQRVCLYFQYNNILDFKRKAFLYSRILREKETKKEIFKIYEPIMERFVSEQLLKGRINENLAELYREYLKYLPISRELSAVLVKILFYHKCTCRDKKITQAVIVHPQLKGEITVPFVKGTAYFPVYTSDAKVFFVDDLGQRYLSIPFELKKLFEEEPYMEQILQYQSESVEAVLYLLEKLKKGKELSLSQSEILKKACARAEFKNSCKKMIRKELYLFYERQNDGDALEDFLLKTDLKDFERKERIRILETFLGRRLYEWAYVYLMEYGTEKIAVDKLVRFLSFTIRDREQEPDAFLLKLCYRVYSKGKYDEQMICYLAKYFTGTDKQMSNLLTDVLNFDANPLPLCEKILTARIQLSVFLEDTETVYRIYRQHGGRKILLEAVITVFSYQYLVGKYVLPWVAKERSYLIKRGNHLNDICRISWIKSILEGEEGFSGYEEIFRQEVERFLIHEQYFEVFEKIESDDFDNYYLSAKRIIEYHGEPGKCIEASYFICSKKDIRNSEEYRRKKSENRMVVRMKEVLPGIYTLPIGMFCDEKLCYEILEQGSLRHASLFEGETVLPVKKQEEKMDRFHRLQNMISLLEEGQIELLAQNALEYETLNLELEAMMKLSSY